MYKFICIIGILSCLGAAPGCKGGSCETDDDCPAGTPVCDTETGKCLASCTPRDSSGCHAGDVYWFDSCGDLGNKIVDCPNGCENGTCLDCTPDCGDRVCGPDPVCGSSCGQCDAGQTCNQDGACQAGCTPDCSGRECGMDPVCGTSCGNCPPDENCNSEGVCVADTCTPDCTNLECGPDPVCGTSCGTCQPDEDCNLEGICIADTCTPDCSNLECGPDPVCGTECGPCAGDDSCSPDGRCGPWCTPGTVRCTDDYAFEACGYSDSDDAYTWGPRVPCFAGDSCSGGVCSRAACLQTEVMFLLDRSSSMLSADTWSWVVEGFLGFVDLRDGANFLGLRMFPSSAACSVGTAGALSLDNYWNIFDDIIDPSNSSATPIASALEGFVGRYGDPNDGQGVVLMTDGDETCDTQQDAVHAASQLWRAGIPVYVLAITTTANKTFLDDVAEAGGTGSATQVTSGSQLISALADIFSDLDACHCADDERICYDADTVYTCGPDHFWQDSTCIGQEQCIEGECVCVPYCGDECGSNVPDGCGGLCICDGQLRLDGGGDSGRLEIFHDGQWGTICDDNFDNIDATVACRELGFENGTFANDNSAGSGPIWMDEVACQGTEARLMDCYFAGWGVHNCGHTEDVLISCY